MHGIKIIAVLALGAAACSGDEKATVSGAVATLNGMVSGATITTDGATATSDAKGRFRLEIPRSGASILTFTRQGYAPAYLEVNPNGAALVTASAVMAKVTTTTSIDVRQASATVQASDLEVTFPQDSIRTASGATPDGPVGVALTWLPQSDAPALGPVPLLGTDGDGVHTLITLGMFDITVTFKGELCQLASGKTLGITFASRSSDPATADLFSVDPKRALWVKEGTATNASGKWTAEIPHLSWWNVDLFYKVPPDRCACVRFVARTADGKGLGGVMIRSFPKAPYTFGGWTDPDGTLCHSCFPTGETVKVTWAAYLGANAAEGLGGVIDVIPTATGVKCGSPACQDVVILASCTQDSHCDPGLVCRAGGCTSGSTPPPTGKMLGSCHVLEIGLCHEFIGSSVDQATAQQVCDSQAAKGTLKLGEACPAANLLGKCTYFPGTPGETATAYYRPLFEGAVDMLKQTCVQGGGTWSP